jgi:Leucine-rich repeat (LRR) protein
VYLEDNMFDEAVDDTFFTAAKGLVHLDVSNCSLTGLVPLKFFEFPDLEVLDMSRNNLVSELRDFVVDPYHGTKLKFLSLHDNNITGTIPKTIGALRNLTVLDLSGNDLTGEMPLEIVELIHLDVLFLGRNNFTEAAFPGWIQYLHNLTELSLKDTSINGTIPEFVGGFKKLQFLDLGENDLTGTVPQALGNLTKLMVLILNENRLEGDLGLGKLTKLETLLIDGNNIKGNTSEMCEHELQHFVSDCAHGFGDFDEKLPAELECECCTLCCYDENVTCNDSDWLGNHEAIWEYGYDRVVWNFEEGGISPLVNYNFLQSLP